MLMHCVGFWQGQDGLPQTMSTRRIGAGSRPLQAHHAGATETLVINPKAGLQARHVSYATGVNGNSMTYHSNSSGMCVTTPSLHHTIASRLCVNLVGCLCRSSNGVHSCRTVVHGSIMMYGGVRQQHGCIDPHQTDSAFLPCRQHHQ